MKEYTIDNNFSKSLEELTKKVKEKYKFMANDIAKRDVGPLTNLSDGKKYGIDLGEEDIIMPRLSLIQPTSQQDGSGKYYLSGAGKTFDTVDVIFFNNTRGRVMFDPDINKGISICGSTDRVTPEPRFETPISKSCLDCRFANRNHVEEIVVGNNKFKQYCSEQMILKGMIVDTLMPFIFAAKRTSLRPINEFLTGAFFESKKLDKALYCFPVRMKSKVPEKAPTKYYIPVLEPLGVIEKSEFEAMFKKYANYDAGKIFEDDSNKDDETGLV